MMTTNIKAEVIEKAAAGRYGVVPSINDGNMPFNYTDLARKCEVLEIECSRLEDRVARLVAEVEVRSVYGNEMIYPANFAAERFAAIAGKKTLNRTDLANIKALGFVVEEVANKKLAA